MLLLGGSSYTPDGERNFVSKCFTFERGQLERQQCFYPDTTNASRSPWKGGPSRLAMTDCTSDEDVARLVAYQALRARTSFATQAECEAAGYVPRYGYEALRAIQELPSCEWTMKTPRKATRDSLTGELLVCPLAPRKRRRSVDSRTGYADDEIRERWRLRQEDLRRRLEDAYARGCNEMNERRQAREAEERRALLRSVDEETSRYNRSPGGTDYSGWCTREQAQEPIACSWDEDVEPDELPGHVNGRRPSVGEAVDLLCAETLSDWSEEEEHKKKEEEYIVIDDSDDGYEEEEDPERAIVAEARALAARQLRLDEGRRLRAAHKAVEEQKKRMLAVPRGVWRFDAACTMEDRLEELKARLTERREAYRLACVDEQGLATVAEWHKERRDYSVPKEQAAAAVSLCLLRDGPFSPELDFGYSPSCIGLYR